MQSLMKSGSHAAHTFGEAILPSKTRLMPKAYSDDRFKNEFKNEFDGAHQVAQSHHATMGSKKGSRRLGKSSESSVRVGKRLGNSKLGVSDGYDGYSQMSPNVSSQPVLSANIEYEVLALSLPLTPTMSPCVCVMCHALPLCVCHVSCVQHSAIKLKGLALEHAIKRRWDIKQRGTCAGRVYSEPTHQKADAKGNGQVVRDS